MKTWFKKPVLVITEFAPYVGKVWLYEPGPHAKPGNDKTYFYFTVELAGEELFESCQEFKKPETAERWCRKSLEARSRCEPVRVHNTEALA